MNIGRLIDIRIVIEAESNKTTVEQEFRLDVDGLHTPRAVLGAFIDWCNENLGGYMPKEEPHEEQQDEGKLSSISVHTEPGEPHTA